MGLTSKFIQLFRLVDENGQGYGVKQVNGKPRVSSMPYTYDIAEHNVKNHESWSKKGLHAAIGTTELDMRPYAAVTAGIGWAYTFPTTELTMTIVSTSASDAVGEVGAQTITVSYLNGSYAEKSVTVSMAGATPVTIATDMFRVQNIRVTTAGTTLWPVGTITIASGGQTYGGLRPTKTSGRQCIWTVPAGKELYITDIYFSCAQQAASKYVLFTLRANYDEKSEKVLQRGLFLPFKEVSLNNTGYNRTLTMPIYLPATVDLKVSAIADSAAIGTCGLTGWTETSD